MAYKILITLALVAFVSGIPTDIFLAGKSHSIYKRSACTATSELTGVQKQELLDAHNQARAIASPAPYEPLTPLTWDDGLASRAQELADSCRFAHDILYDCANVRMGQNLAMYGSSDTTVADDMSAHVKRWDDEKADYDLATGSCSKVCGHYTQLVWAATTKVGCGYKNCNKLYNIDGSLKKDFGAGSAWYLVCNYNPAGNFNGQKPYETEYVELTDLSGEECAQWIYQYCNDATYGTWANTQCALTCSAM